MCQRLSNICFRQHPPSANRYVHVCTLYIVQGPLEFFLLQIQASLAQTFPEISSVVQFNSCNSSNWETGLSCSSNFARAYFIFHVPAKLNIMLTMVFVEQIESIFVGKCTRNILLSNWTRICRFLYFGPTKNTFLSESERTSKEAAQKNFLIVFPEIYVEKYSTIS